jgi:hypothetical protein
MFNHSALIAMANLAEHPVLTTPTTNRLIASVKTRRFESKLVPLDILSKMASRLRARTLASVSVLCITRDIVDEHKK